MPIKAFPINKVETIKKHFLRPLNSLGIKMDIFKFECI